MNPSQMFQAARARFHADADALQAGFFYFSPVNVQPKLDLGKLTIVGIGDAHALVDASGTARVIPGGTRAEYYRATLDALANFRTLGLVPEWIAANLKSGYRVALQHREYLVESATLADLDGPELRTTRRNVAQARAATVANWWSGADAADLLKVNKAWYRDAKTRMFRTYDKASLDYLLDTWETMAALFPDIRVTLQRSRTDGRLLGFNVGCALTAGTWTSYSQRYLREPDARGVNFLGMQRLAAELPGATGNVGTADNATIRDWKDRLTRRTLAAYTVTRK